MTARDETGASLTVTESETSASVTIEDVQPGMVITFTNTKNVIIETGISLDSLPYVLILAGVAAVAVLFLLRRRRSYED